MLGSHYLGLYALDSYIETEGDTATVRATQLALEVLLRTSVPVGATQLAVEILLPYSVLVAATQLALELFRANPADTRTTQIVVELFTRLMTCPDSSFPVDTVTPGGACLLPEVARDSGLD